MWTSDGWMMSMPRNLAEDLALSLVALCGEEGGLGAITYRSLARHVRMAPGTITNHYASKQELWGVCASVVGRWLTHATSDHVQERGPIGLFPATEDHDRTYRLLASSWAQFRAYALTDPAVDERVQGILPLLRGSVRGALAGGRPEPSLGGWMCLESLRQEVVRPGSSLTPEAALHVLSSVEPLTGLAGEQLPSSEGGRP